MAQHARLQVSRRGSTMSYKNGERTKSKIKVPQNQNWPFKDLRRHYNEQKDLTELAIMRAS